MLKNAPYNVCAELNQSISLHWQSWINSSGILKSSKRPGLHYWCAVNDRRSWADCVSCHALWIAEQRASVCEPPSLYLKRKEKGRVGQEESGRANSPPPAWLPNSLCLKLAEQLRGAIAHSWSSFSSSLQRPGRARFQTWELVCETLRSLCTLTGGCSAQKCVCGLMGLIPWASGVAMNI